jgi:hypothetical protein
MNVGQAFGCDQESFLRDFTGGVRAHTPPPQHPPDDLVVGVKHASEALCIGSRPSGRVIGFWHRLAVGHSLSPQTEFLLCASDPLLITKSDSDRKMTVVPVGTHGEKKCLAGDHLCVLRA